MKKFFSLGAALSLALLLLAFHLAQAQTATPQLLITWKATDSSAPVGYSGKLLPGVNGPVIASVEAIAGGSLVNLRSQTIYWYVDGSFQAGGVGQQTVSFTAPGHAEIMTLRVDLSGYPGGDIIKTIQIPVQNPRVVINAPYPGNQFAGQALSASAIPYFFTAAQLDNLIYQWSVNGQTPAAQDNPQDLTINLSNNAAANYNLNISLVVRVNGDPLTTASANTTLTSSGQF